jgi:hypothetical protein
MMSKTIISPSIIGVATYRLFQTWTSSLSKSCNCLMETEHTSENNIGSLVGVNDDKSASKRFDWCKREVAVTANPTMIADAAVLQIRKTTAGKMSPQQ